jgi:serine/threonine protein kinase
MGQYELLEAIGQGGMGTVYRGRHHLTGQTVAVKVMAPEVAADPVPLKRFEQECAAASRLRHPHIVQGLGFGVENGQPYLVMEFVAGQNLGQRIHQHGPLAEAEAVRLILQIADALQLAHQEQLIHRDVKPENILLTAAGQAKLTDLGLIKDLAAATNLTRTRTGLGTITFMAPEQFGDAKHADARCDVYGLAGTLYYALTGVAPFVGRGNLTILQKKLQNDFVPPRRLAPSLGGPIDQAICRALDASPQKRPNSCAEFAALLTAAQPGAEVIDGGRVAAWGIDPEVTSVLQPVERRRARRYPSRLDASCRSLAGDKQRWRAEVQDISRTGVRLQLACCLEPGAVLSVEVPDEPLGAASARQVRVCWVRQVGPREWRVGCAFHRVLAEDELNRLLGNMPTTVVVRPGG